MDLIFVSLFVLLALAVGLFALAIPQGGARWWGLAGLMVALVIASRLVGESWAGILLLDAAELVAAALIWVRGTAEARGAARAYLSSIVPASVCIAVAMLLVEDGVAGPASTAGWIAVSLLVVGFALKLGLLPFYFWLPRVASGAATMTTALIIGVVDIATLAELAALRESAPWVFADFPAPWLVVAVLSLLGGSLLALAQTSLKRMLAFSTIDDLGYLLLGLVAGSSVGMAGVWLAALSHAASKVVLFGAVGIAEHGTGREVTLDARGLLARFPLAGAAFIAAGLGFIGVPPALGFAGHWRLYVAGTEYGGLALLSVMIVASALALLYYVRAIHQVWLGPVPESDGAEAAPVPAGRVGLAAGVVVALAVALVLFGVFPDVLLQQGGPLGALAHAR